MEKVTGIGGVFLRATDLQAMAASYGKIANRTPPQPAVSVSDAAA